MKFPKETESIAKVIDIAVAFLRGHLCLAGITGDFYFTVGSLK